MPAGAERAIHHIPRQRSAGALTNVAAIVATIKVLIIGAFSVGYSMTRVACASSAGGNGMPSFSAAPAWIVKA